MSGLLTLSLERKLKTALDETRLLILGAQVLYGFQFHAAFQELFQQLPRFCRYLECIALMLLMVSVALLITPSLWHRIVEQAMVPLSEPGVDHVMLAYGSTGDARARRAESRPEPPAFTVPDWATRPAPPTSKSFGRRRGRGVDELGAISLFTTTCQLPCLRASRAP